VKNQEILVAMLASVAVCQPPSLIVDGGNGKTVTLTAAHLSKLPQHTVNAADHGAPATFEGVLLSDVLAEVDSPSGEKLRGKLMSQYLLVEAADGYRAVFALQELDAGFTDRKIDLVTQRDGNRFRFGDTRTPVHPAAVTRAWPVLQRPTICAGAMVANNSIVARACRIVLECFLAYDITLLLFDRRAQFAAVRTHPIWDNITFATLFSARFVTVYTPHAEVKFRCKKVRG
jgi:hypothetical protein